MPDAVPQHEPLEHRPTGSDAEVQLSSHALACPRNDNTTIGSCVLSSNQALGSSDLWLASMSSIMASCSSTSRLAPCQAASPSRTAPRRLRSKRPHIGQRDLQPGTPSSAVCASTSARPHRAASATARASACW